MTAAVLSALIALVIAVHVAWIASVSVGGVLALAGRLAKSPKLETAYLSVIVLTVFNRLFDEQCWITKAELFLRAKLTGETVRYGFIEHYLSLADIHIKDGVLFFVGAIWIAIGLCAVAYHELTNHKRCAAVGISEA